MQTFHKWLGWGDDSQDYLTAQLRLIETYYSYDPQKYDQLFNEELEKLIEKITTPEQRKVLEAMRGFRWTAYISAAVRSAGFSERRDNLERTNDIVTRLLMGQLFKGFSPTLHGPFDKRFKRSVGNAVRSQIELLKARQRNIPTVPLQQTFQAGGSQYADIPARPIDDPHNDRLIHEFQKLVLRQLGSLALAVLDARLNGMETKSLYGFPDLGSPSAWEVKQAVQQIKQLARQFAVQSGDEGFVRMIDAAMQKESATIAKRQLSTAARIPAVRGG